MNDRIIEGYLKDFVDSNNLGHLSESEAYEHFINYCVVSRVHPENFEFEQVSVGGTGGPGNRWDSNPGKRTSRFFERRHRLL